LSVQLVDEKSLIKKYQREISSLKQELDEFRRGMIGGASQEEIMILRQQVCFIFLLRDRTKQQKFVRHLCKCLILLVSFYEH
jgi:hypothetical protein